MKISYVFRSHGALRFMNDQDSFAVRQGYLFIDSGIIINADTDKIIKLG